MATKTCVSIIGSDGDNPIVSGDSQGNLKRLSALFNKLASGHKPVAYSVYVNYSAVAASGTVTMAAVQNADTVTIGGVVFTAQQAYATGTVTIVIANTDVDDTVTINGVAFTAKNAENTASRQFDISGTATAAATSLVACITASTHVDITGVVTATSSAGVVTIRAVAAGTGGNSITLASSDADGLAVSAATLENGAAVANNKFCFTGSNTQVATDFVRAFNASTSTLLPNILSASSSAAVVTFTSKVPGQIGNFITLVSSNGTRLAVSPGSVLGSGADSYLGISL